MNIEETIRLHERLQDLLDRKTRLLQDLLVIDREIADLTPDLPQGLSPHTVPTQRALPPMGRPAKAGAPKGRKKTAKKKEKTAKKTAKRIQAKGGGLTLQARSEIVLKEFGRKTTLTATMLVEVLEVEKLTAQNLMVTLCKSGFLDRTGRGEYQLS